jgi:hypothetical protein
MKNPGIYKQKEQVVKKVNKVKVTKTELLIAIINIYLEYKDGTHKLSISKCALCRLYVRNNNYIISCDGCPMTVFKKGDKTYPCMNRKCKPVDCLNIKFNLFTCEELQAVEEFYKEFIEIVKGMKAIDLKDINAFAFLKKLDRKIAKKYNL